MCCALGSDQGTALQLLQQLDAGEKCTSHKAVDASAAAGVAAGEALQEAAQAAAEGAAATRDMEAGKIISVNFLVLRCLST